MKSPTENIIDQQQYSHEPSGWEQSQNFIHPTAIVDETVRLGSGNYIGPYCNITGKTVIGNNNRFEAFCSIGTRAEHKQFCGEGETEIGNNNTFREFVTVNAGTESKTRIGNDCWLLKGSHVGHDVILEDSVTLACNVLIGGHSYLMKGCNFGLGSVCHQRSIIGSYAMIGMNAVVTKSSRIFPFVTFAGVPAKIIGPNNYQIKLHCESVEQENLRYRAKL
jgi:UDP-N-acetylglucosamine acyltransferase